MTFREVKGHLLYAFSESLINDKDFALLYVLNTLKNRDFHCWEYDWFDLGAVSEDDVYAEFRYLKNDIKRLERALWLPNEIICSFYSDLRIDSVEVLCILLKRLAYPNRYSDMNTQTDIQIWFHGLEDLLHNWARLLTKWWIKLTLSLDIYLEI